jgi:hypothetical protein
LNIDLDINNKSEDCKIGTVGGVLMSGEVNEGDEDEGIWLVDFIYINKIEK